MNFAILRRRGSRGLTMTEVVISTVIVGAMIISSLQSVGTVFRMRRINSTALTGPGLAQELLDEALSMPYEDPQNPGGAIGVDSGESTANRATFDDVDDYNGWSVSDAKSRTGTALPGYTGWQCQIQVAWAQLANPVATSGSESGIKRITVTVTSPDGTATVLTALRARYGSLEQKPTVKISAITSLGAELKLGSATRSERWGGRPVNHADDPN